PMTVSHSHFGTSTDNGSKAAVPSVRATAATYACHALNRSDFEAFAFFSLTDTSIVARAHAKAVSLYFTGATTPWLAASIESKASFSSPYCFLALATASVARAKACTVF